MVEENQNELDEELIEDNNNNEEIEESDSNINEENDIEELEEEFKELSEVIFVEDLDNIPQSRTFTSVQFASAIPDGATGKKHEFEILEAVSGGYVIDEPNNKLVKSSLAYYSNYTSTSNSSSADLLSNLLSESRCGYNMTWNSSTDYMIIKTTKPCRVYTATLNNTYMRTSSLTTVYSQSFNGSLSIKRLVGGGEYIDYTISTKSTGTGSRGTAPTLMLYINELPRGTWKFSYKSRRIDGFWYLEELEEEVDPSLKVNKIEPEDVPKIYEYGETNRIDFVSDGSLFIPALDGMPVQIGCSRVEYEELKEKVLSSNSTTGIDYDKINW